MYAAPGIPSGIIERTDAASLRNDALRLCEKIRACEEVACTLESVTGTVRSLHARTDGDAQASLVDVLKGLADAVDGARAAGKALNEQISPAMEDVL
jgi:hypothetical protein